MKRLFSVIFLLGIFFVVENVLALPALSVKPLRFFCEGDVYRIQYSLVNEYTYNQRVALAFKVIKGGKVIGCKRISLTIPAGSDGSEIHEISIKADCNERETDTNLKIKLFSKKDMDRVNYWLLDCP